jgi:multiple sugar transport system substrate-binding protein
MFDRIRRRKLLATVALAALALTVGLGAGETHAQSSEKVALKLANSQWLDALRGKNLWAAVSKYQEANPNVTLEQEAIPSAEFADKLTTEMGAGQGPGCGDDAGRPVLRDCGCRFPRRPLGCGRRREAE